MNQFKVVNVGSRSGRLGVISMRKAQKVNATKRGLERLRPKAAVVSLDVLKRAGAACRADKRKSGD